MSPSSARERRGRLRGPAKGGHVDGVDVQRGEPSGDTLGLLAAFGGERWVAMPVHERERRFRLSGLGFTVPDKQYLSRTWRQQEPRLAILGRHLVIITREGHNFSRLPGMASPSGGGLRAQRLAGPRQCSWARQLGQAAGYPDPPGR